MIDTTNATALAATIADEHDVCGGSTWRIAGESHSLRGAAFFAVVAFPNRSVTIDGSYVSPQAIDAFIKDNKDLLANPHAALGTWYDGRKDHSLLEVALTLRTRENAMAVAREFDQEFIYDLCFDCVLEVPKNA